MCPPSASPQAATLIRLEGRDALDLLHRISTQHLVDLEAGASRTTLFCDFRGRVQHRVAIARTADGGVWIVRADAPATELLASIDRQIFRDEVRIEDRSAGTEVVLAASAVGAPPGTFDEREGRPQVLHLEGGVDLVVAPESETPALDEVARIRLGAPRHAHEIRDDFNPFEIGLARDVHLDKGCFTGQEALLRMMTYGGVRRRLALLEGGGAPPARGDAVHATAGDVGIVTSAAREGPGWVALAVLKRDAVASGAILSAGSAVAIAHVTPFADARPLGLPDAAAEK